jgi:cytoskeletal protein CcmA (bactofilin family)
MIDSTRVLGRLLAMALALAPWRAATGQEAGASIVKTGREAEDLYLAGASVEVSGDVRGDLVAAGGNVVAGGQIRGGVLAVGGQVVVSGKVQEDVRAFGGTFRLEGQVGHDVAVAGGNVALSSGASVAGRAMLAGQKVEVAGKVGRQLKAAGAHVAILGEVGGDADVAAEVVEIGPAARIAGDLTYTSPTEAHIAPGARIAGTVVHHPGEHAPGASRPGRLLWGALMLAGHFLAAVLFLLAFPRFSIVAARHVGDEPVMSLGLGLALLVAWPFAALVLVATVVGLPLGLAALAFYLVLLFAAYLATAVALGDLALGLVEKQPGAEPALAARFLSVAGALLVLRLVRLVPLLGGTIGVLAVVFGLGALGIELYRTYRGAGGASVSAHGPASKAE